MEPRRQTSLAFPSHSYGDFLPMLPGPAALRTMADIDTGQYTNAVVNVIKLQLDVNHDGTMDLSFAGPDNTFAGPAVCVFWVNNDYDRWHNVDCSTAGLDP